MPATRPHQVDRRQQVSGETDDDQQYGDSERKSEPLGVQPAAACRAWPGQAADPPSAATRPKKRAIRPASGTKVAMSLSRWLHVGEGHRISIPAIQPSPLATGPKMISHGAHASQRRLPGGGAPASAAIAAGSPTLVEEGPDTCRVAGIELGPLLFDVLVHFGEDLLPPGGLDALQRCVQLRQIAPDKLVGLAGRLSGSHSGLPSSRISSTASRKTRHCFVKVARASSPSVVRR